MGMGLRRGRRARAVRTSQRRRRKDPARVGLGLARNRHRNLCFLYGLSAKVALVIEKPNEKSKNKHWQNKPELYCGEVGQDGCASDHCQYVAEGVKSGFPMQALCPSDTSSPEIDHIFTLPSPCPRNCQDYKSKDCRCNLAERLNSWTRAVPSHRSAPRPIKPGLGQLVVPSAGAGGLRRGVSSRRICNRIAMNNIGDIAMESFPEPRLLRHLSNTASQLKHSCCPFPCRRIKACS
jgi:hypothetical protein